MKTLPVIALLAVAGTSFAPQEPEKKTVPDPSALQEAFLKALKAGDVGKAYDALVKGTSLEAQKEQLEKQREMTEKSIKARGGIVTWDNAGIIRQDKHQALGIAILCCDQAPVFFYFTWYRNTETGPWVLLGVNINDMIKDYWLLKK